MAVRTVRLCNLHKAQSERTGRIAFVHAALDWRAVELFSALAIVRGGVNVVLTSSPSVARATIEGIVGSRARFESWHRAFGIRIARNREIWVMPRDHDLEDLPFKDLDGLYITDADRIVRSPVSKLADPRRDLFVAGWPPEATTWWADFVEDRRASIVKIPAAQILEAFPDQASRVIEVGKPGHARLMLLEPEPEQKVEDKSSAQQITVEPIQIFARRRLRVRTERVAEALSQVQVDEARQQLGASWRPGKFGTPLVRLDLSPAQRRYMATKRRARAMGFNKFLVLKDRRVGVTTIEQAESYQLVSQSPQSWVATIAHRDEDARLIFEAVKTFHRNDPEAVVAVGDSKRALELANGSKFFVGTAGASGFARGSGLRRFHGSEIAKWCKKSKTQDEDIEELMAGVLGALAGECVLETTAQGFDWFKRKWDEAKDLIKRGHNDGFFPIFLAWFRNPANRFHAGQFDPEEIVQTMTDEEKALVAKHGLDPGQIAWRRSKIRQFGKRFRQEFPEDDQSAFIATGSCYFEPLDNVQRLLDALPLEEDLAAWRKLCPDYKRRPLPGGHEVICKEPIAGHEYVIGADCSTGIAGGDPNGLGVIDRTAREQVAWTHGLFSIPDQAEHAVRMAKKYFDAILGIEREDQGHAVLQKVIDLGYGRSTQEGGALYYHANIAAARGVTHERVARAGWSTNGSTRDVMFHDLSAWIEHGGILIRDPLMLRECFTFKLQKDGKFAAGGKDHDDALAKWAIAGQMLRVRKARPSIFVLPGSL